MVRYSFDLGIPDDEWFRSPGDDGCSIQYFPNFQDRNFWNKAQFDYYGDVFYYKWFSALDTIGQVLNLAHRLKISQPAFNSAMAALKKVDAVLHSDLSQKVLDTAPYKEAVRFRHDITHNFLPGHVGKTMRVTESTTGLYAVMHVGDYTTSAAIMANVIQPSVSIIDETVHYTKSNAYRGWRSD